MGIARHVVSILAIAATSLAAFAAPGDPDPTFGTNGVQLIDFGGAAPVRIAASVRQSSGKVVVVGQSLDPATNQNQLAFGRLNVDGSPDVTFGSGGWALLSGNGDLTPVAMALTAGDALRVVGKRNGQYTFIARMDPDGANSMLNQVMVDENPLSLDEAPRAMTWLASSQVAVAGSCRQYVGGPLQACVVTYSEAGYRNYGPIFLGTPGFTSDALAITADECSSGGFFAAGRVDSGMNRDVFIAKMRPDLTLDPIFGNRQIDFGGLDEAYAVAMRACGHVMVAGRSESGGVGQVAMASMSSFDGTLDITDNTFGVDGKVVLPVQWQGAAADAGVSSLNFSWGAVFPDGIFTLITVRPNAGESHLVAARFSRNGTLLWMSPLMGAAGDGDAAVGVHDINPYRDSVIALGARNGVELVAAKYDMNSGMADAGYGSAGILHYSAYFATQDSLAALAAHPAGGYAGVQTTNGGIFGLFRTTPDGRLDPAFGSDGVVALESGSYQVAVQPDGKIITAHEAHSVPGNPYSRIVAAVERFHASGVRDASFGGGRVIVDFGGDGGAADLLVQPDGKILVAGSVGLSNPQRIRMAVARLNADGSVDSTFMGGIVVVAAALAGDEQAQSIALLSDGRIIIGGRVAGATGAYGWTVYRLLPGGGQDPSWNGGAPVVQASCAPISLSKLAVGPGDSVVVAGAIQRTNDSDACFARFLADGSPDASFGALGVAYPNLGLAYDSAGGVAVDSFGRVAATVSGYGAPTMIRLNPDGSFDTSFGSGGAVRIPNISPDSMAIYGLIRHPDDKLLAWGAGGTFADSDALLARFEGGGVPIPDTAITGMPPNPSTGAGATFTFTSSVPAATIRFECMIDGGPWGACTSPRIYSVSQGSHTFQVRAVSSVGPDPTPASYTWQVNLSQPDTTITSGPSDPTPIASTSATFTFTSNEADATFQCSLDNAAYAACASPTTYDNLIQGGHLFNVRAVGSGGTLDPTPARRIFTVDTTPPETTITSGIPPQQTNATSATFAFTSNDPNATFQCRIDNLAFAACASPVTYGGLVDGNHSFFVRATDVAGNTDPSAASAFWTVDTVAPETTLTTYPPAIATTNGASFSFTSSEAFSTFECSLDGAGYSACTSPVTYSGLAEGPHTFAARATDAAGNIDPSPAFAAFTVDVTPPDTSIASAPSALTSSRNASFTFSSGDGTARFECALDAGAYAACTSPVTYASLAEGLHSFHVRAVDAAGNADGSPASHQWTVDATAPDTLVTSGPALATSATTATFTFQATEPGATFECGLDTAVFTPCATPATFAGLAEGVHQLTVRAVDAAGNVDPSPSVFTWTVDVTNPDTTIVGTPPPLVTRQADATFLYTSNEPSALFQCRLDGAPFGNCAGNGIVYAGLAEGTHTFEVRAVDAAGNVDPQPAAWTWTIDVTPPSFIGIGYNVQSPTSATTFTATFFSEPNATFECRLDGAPFATCPSSVTLTGLADGSHTLDARPKDAAGNVGSIGSVTWVVDTVAPDTTITGGPAGVVASNQATFTLGASEPLVPIDCRLDGAPFASCGSPVTFTGLADGSHTFEARARDFAGNVDATPASRTWTVDTTAPDTAITSGPSGTVASSSASIAFSSEAGASFECRLDGAAFAACSSPASLSGLAQGSHAFEVRARDAVGNVDATPAARTWTVDTLAPETTISSGPSGAVSSTSATFTFSASEPATFQCRIDGSAYTACLPDGITYLGGAQGSHTFEVRAIDAVGNADPTPASRTWIIDTIAPDTSITGGPTGNNNPDTATFTFASTEAGSTFECSLDAAAFSACASGIVYAGLAKGEHTFQVRAIDAAGNVDATAASRTWRVNK